MASIAADVVLLLHVAFICYVVLGLLLVLAGLLARWRWVRGFWFRITHLAAIAIVVAQAWAGVVCPLTTLENHLRIRAGESGYETTFVAHWLRTLIFYEAEPWVFTVCYSIFGALVVLTWLFCRPRLPGWLRRRSPDPG